MTEMAIVLELTPFFQAFPRIYKHPKGYEIVNLKNVYKILLPSHHYLGNFYLFQSL